MAKVLIIDAGESWGNFLARACRIRHDVATETMRTALTVESWNNLLQEHQPDLVVFPALSRAGKGEEILEAIQKTGRPVACVVATAEKKDPTGQAEEAFHAACKAGATPLLFPTSVDQVMDDLDRALSRAGSADDIPIAFPSLVGHGPQMRRVFLSMFDLAAQDEPVLLIGELGTGKKTVAREIHRLRQGKKNLADNFIVVPCAAQEQTVLEEELFGAPPESGPRPKKGRLGMLELAVGTGVYLRDVAELSLPLQLRVLRWLERNGMAGTDGQTARQVDVNLYASTIRELWPEVHRNIFLDELYSILSRNRIELPPLRAHRNDIPALVDNFLGKHRSSGQLVRYTAEAMEMLSNFNWPRNVAQLEEVVIRAARNCEGATIREADLPAEIVSYAKRKGDSPRAYYPPKSKLASES